MPAVFLSNDMLQQWSDQGKVRLDDTTLTLLGENRTVELTPAVRFTAMIDGEDSHKLLGKVKTKAQIQELGAEHYMDSVIYGDVGYTVVEGFLGDLAPKKKAPKPPVATLTPMTAPMTEPMTEPTPDPFAPTDTDIHLVRKGSEAPTSPVPAAVDLGPVGGPVSPTTKPKDEAPAKLSEAEALSALFLSTVKE